MKRQRLRGLAVVPGIAMLLNRIAVEVMLAIWLLACAHLLSRHPVGEQA
ncbi:MAG: hypothetical protein ACI9SB_000977 [Candidatus Azotimanducaceae bacterium]|jgi:hypothetical protein